MSKKMSPEKQKKIFGANIDYVNTLTTQAEYSWQFYIDPKPRNENDLCRDKGRFIYMMKTQCLEFVVYPFRLDDLVRITSCIKGLTVTGLLRNTSFYWFPAPPDESKTGYKILAESPEVLEEFIERLRDCYKKNKIKTIHNEDLSDDFQNKFKILYNIALEEHIRKTKS